MTIEIPAAIPEKMQAISIGADKSPDSLSLSEHDTPRPDKHEILVKIGAAGQSRRLLSAHGVLSATAWRVGNYGAGICRNGRGLRVGRHALAARRAHCRSGGRRWLCRIRGRA